MPNSAEPRAPGGSQRAQISLPGVISVVLLLVETSVPAFYFTSMALLAGFLAGPLFLAFLLVAVLCFLSVAGVILCVFGVVLRTSFFKWLLVSLSVLGLLPLPVTILYGVADAETLVILSALAGWGAVLFVTTLVAFSYIDMAKGQKRGHA
jgi:hypothetical protein